MTPLQLLILFSPNRDKLFALFIIVIFFFKISVQFYIASKHCKVSPLKYMCTCLHTCTSISIKQLWSHHQISSSPTKILNVFILLGHMPIVCWHGGDVVDPMLHRGVVWWLCRLGSHALSSTGTLMIFGSALLRHLLVRRWRIRPQRIGVIWQCVLGWHCFCCKNDIHVFTNTPSNIILVAYGFWLKLCWVILTFYCFSMFKLLHFHI